MLDVVTYKIVIKFYFVVNMVESKKRPIIMSYGNMSL